MKSLLLAATLACGLAAGISGAHAMPATMVLRTDGVTSAVTPVDYYWNHHHYHHRRWSHGHWRYWN